jgi:hypothetical protein
MPAHAEPREVSRGLVRQLPMRSQSNCPASFGLVAKMKKSSSLVTTIRPSSRPMPTISGRPSGLPRALRHAPHRVHASAAKRPTSRATGYPPGISRGNGDDSVIHLTCRIAECGRDILIFKKGIVGKNLFPRRSCRDQIQNITHPQAVAANAWPASALALFDGDAFQEFHGTKLSPNVRGLNLEIGAAGPPDLSRAGLTSDQSSLA